MKTLSKIMLLAIAALVLAAGTAMAVRPSGPGRSTAANSLSVVLASDHADMPYAPKGNIVTPVTRDTDMTATCKDGVVVGAAGDGGLEVVGAGNAADAGVRFTVIAGQHIPMAIKYVLTDDGGTSVGANLNCLSH